MPHILITGSNGQLGSELQRLSVKHPTWQFTFTDVDTLDITNLQALEDFCINKSIDYIVNCAAYTAVDKAESNQEAAMMINRDAVSNLTKVAEKKKAAFIHISTDYVFDGTACMPYKEDQPTHPQSVYGSTKAAGEDEALKYNKSIVIRTAWLYSSFGNNFVKTMLRLGNERNELGVVFDQVGTPTYARDLASGILSVIAYGQTRKIEAGIYHFSNEGVCSWYDFAWEIMNYAQKKCLIKPLATKDYPTPAKRPAFSVFDKTKIKNTFNINIPYWKTSLYECLDELKNI
jgi:dTDP-4-dehydrorhamnose reductase